MKRNALIIHSPYDYPLNFEQHSLLNGYSYDIIVEPEILKTDQYFKNVKLSDRKCYFEGEKKLNFFKIYSQHNCQAECQSKNGEF